MRSKIQDWWDKYPFEIIMILALALRLTAAIFAKGYGMHDDHYLVIEASQSWVDGTDYNNWLPQNQINPRPEGHSFFYVGTHFLLFSLMKLVGIIDPSTKMYIIRILHALFSLIVVAYGFKITQKLTNKKTASMVGLLLAVFWFMPFLGVRNLVEVACVPFLMFGTWLIVNAETRKHLMLQFLYAGLIMGIAFSVRFQTLIFIGGTGLALLFTRKWKEAIVFGLGAFATMVAIQGTVDLFIWHRPFAELTEYVIYNIQNKDAYGTRNVWMYLELVPALLIPPVGLFLFAGFFLKWKKYLLLFLPSFLFFVFHTFFPNKQERFILSIVPFIIMLGYMGWQEFISTSNYWEKHKLLLKNCWIFFWVVNLILLPILTTTYSKRARVEAMIYLSKYQNINALVAQNETNESAYFLPEFYLGQWVPFYMVSSTDEGNKVAADTLLSNGHIFKGIASLKYFTFQTKEKQPTFLLLYGEKGLNERVQAAKMVFPAMTFETRINPGYIDRIMLKLTPSNQNQPIFIYKLH
jgi:hypothetical protein